MDEERSQKHSGRRSSLVGTARAILMQVPTTSSDILDTTPLPGIVAARRASNSIDASLSLEGSSNRRLSTIDGPESNRRLSVLSNSTFASTATTVHNIHQFSQKLRRASMEAATSFFEAAASIAAMQEEKPPEPRNNIAEIKDEITSVMSPTVVSNALQASQGTMTSARRASLDSSGRRLVPTRPPLSERVTSSHHGSRIVEGNDSLPVTQASNSSESSTQDMITVIAREVEGVGEGVGSVAPPILEDILPITNKSELQVHCRCELHSLDRIQTAEQTWSGDVSLLFTVSIPLEMRTFQSKKLHQAMSFADKSSFLSSSQKRNDPKIQKSRQNKHRSTNFVGVDAEDDLDPGSLHSRSDDTVDNIRQPLEMTNKIRGQPTLSRNVRGTFYGLQPIDDTQSVDNLIKSWDDDEEEEDKEKDSVNIEKDKERSEREGKLCLKTRDPNLTIPPPQEYIKEHSLASINDVSLAGQEYINLIEMHLLPIHLTNILGGESFVIDRTIVTHCDIPPAAIKPCRIKTGSPIDGSFSCFTLVKRYKATFRQMFSLYQFPLDTQWLIVECELGKSLEELSFASVEETPISASYGRIFEEGKADMLVLEPGHCPALSEWDLHKRIICQTYETEAERSRSAQQFSRQRFLFKVRRKYGAYIENVGFTVFLIGSLTGMAWFIDSSVADSVTSRLNFLVTLLLSAVSFRFVVRSYLPTLSYMTLLDYYVRSGLIFITIACIEVAVLAVLAKTGYTITEISSIDNTMWIVNGFFWVLYNLYCFILIARHALSHNEKALYTDRTYVEAQAQAKAAAMLTLNENDAAPPDAQGDFENRSPISSLDGRPYSRKNSKDRSHGNASWINKVKLVEESSVSRSKQLSLSLSQLDFGRKYGWTFSSH